MRTVLLSVLFLFGASAHAGGTIQAKKASGITVQKIKNAKSPTPLATFDHNGKNVEIRCMGKDKSIVCQLHDPGQDRAKVPSSALTVCYVGNDMGILTNSMGLKGRKILISGMAAGQEGTLAKCAQ